ncbi:MAG: hypothetical protein QF464_16965, partial [Myxococcota bacterium]|nr:hypothetical protein [Myxococcota bacterium]
MIALARTLVRLLDPSPGCRVALSLPNAALDEAVRGLLEAAGANVVTDGGAHGSVVQIDGVHPFVPRSSRLAIDLVSTGGQVVAAALDGAGRMGGDELVDYWRHRLRCDQLTALPVKSMVVLSGPRSSTLSNQARKRLRAVGHALEPSVLIGRAGIS